MMVGLRVVALAVKSYAIPSRQQQASARLPIHDKIEKSESL